MPGDTETGGIRFASIAFGYPNALWENSQSPIPSRKQTKGERKNVGIYTWHNDRRSNGNFCNVSFHSWEA